MKPRILFWLASLLVAAAGSGSPEPGERVVLEEIVARVNNRIITLSELEQNRQLMRREMMQKYAGDELEQKLQEEERNLLRDMIDQSLLVQRATDRGASVEADVVKQLERMRQERGLATQEEFERAVAAQGMDIEDLRQRVREQLLTQMVIQREVAHKVIVNNEDVQQYYEQHKEELQRPERVRLREILVSTQGLAPAELPAREERVREVLEKIRRGDKFEDLARTYSDAPTAADGGDLGIFETEKLATHIQEIVGKLREGGVSDPFLTQQGYLILQLVEHLPAGIPPFEKVEPELRQKLFYDQVQPAMRTFLSALRREAFVYVKSGYVDSGAVEPAPKPVRRGKQRRPEKTD